MLPLASRESLLARVVCPKCQGRLAQGASATADLQCVGCGREYGDRGTRWIDLWPRQEWSWSAARWGERQEQTETAYRELIADPEHARLAYRYDFEPYRPLLTEFVGRVLDVGGGNGLLRHVLPEGAEYVSLDPSVSWLDDSWLSIADTYPCLRQPLAYVMGVGEHLPFPTRSFDAAVSFWCLNHASRPDVVLRELARVLQAGAPLLLVLDDVPPKWRDIAAGVYRDGRYPSKRALIAAKLASAVRGWPLQEDHLRLRERMLQAWSRQLFIWERRSFVGSYYTLLLRKPADRQHRDPA